MPRSFLWSSRLVPHDAAGQAPVRASAAAITVVIGGEPESDRCGWFDSSHELGRGLQVRELQGIDDLADDLPVAQWLELQRLIDCASARA